MKRHSARPHAPSRAFLLAALLVAACLLVLAAGCGESDTAETVTPAATVDTEATADAAIDACTLLTGADVDAVLGVTVGKPTSQMSGEGAFWVSMCTYEADTANEIRTAGLLLKRHNGSEGAVNAYSDYEAGLIAELGDDGALAPVDGVGERAGWQDFGTPIGQLAVFQGPYMLILSVGGGDDRLSDATALAKRVLPRLPTE